MARPGKIIALDSLVEEQATIYVCIFDEEQTVIAQKRVNTWSKASFPITSNRGTRRNLGSTSYDLFPSLASSSRDGISLNQTKPLVFPGGVARIGEKIWDAAKRTFFECTGYKIDVFTESPKLAKIRAKRFEDKFDGRRLCYYAVYINITELSASDARRNVGVYERGQTIFNNFNVGEHSKRAFRQAINSGQITDKAPIVQNDELEFVEYRPIIELVDAGKRSSSAATLTMSFDELSVDDTPSDMDAECLKSILTERDLVCGSGCVTRKPAFYDQTSSPAGSRDVNASPVSLHSNSNDSGFEQRSRASNTGPIGLSNFTRSIVTRTSNSSRK